jgi:amidase
MSQAVPETHPSSDQLWRWSATELARGIATRQISASEAVDSCLARIEEVNPQVNALVEGSWEEAREAAAEADRLTASGAELGPLHGVPVAIKVNSDQAGHATTNGIAAFKDNIADKDSPQVEWRPPEWCSTGPMRASA